MRLSTCLEQEGLSTTGDQKETFFDGSMEIE